MFHTTVHGLPFVCFDDIEMSSTFAKGEYELSETIVLLSAIKPGHIVVDAGANIGYYTVLFAKAVGSTGKVYSFEPEFINLSLLRTNVNKNNFSNVEIYPVALGDCEKEGNLYLNSTNSGDHRTWNDDTSTCERQSISFVTLDKVLSEVPHIDVLKIDVQGDEERVLRGAQSIISRSPNVIICVEYWPYGLIHSGSSPENFLSILYESGFSVLTIQESYDGPHLVPYDRGTLLRCQKDHDALLNLWCFKKR